ncbi:MAG: hypothetical protein R2716_02620 [Microthrixaceae bacterium]
MVSRRTGDFLEAYDIQRQLRDGFRDPLTRLVEAGVDIATGQLHDVYNLAFALGFAVLFVIAVRHRQRLSWLALMVVTWVVAAGASNMDSVGRYCLVAAPFVVALAQWARTRNRQLVALCVGGAGTIWFTSEVLLGRIIPEGPTELPSTNTSTSMSGASPLPSRGSVWAATFSAVSTTCA